MAKEFDVAVEAFRARPFDAGPYTFVAAGAQVREQGRVVNVHELIAVGVNADGYRESPGTDVTTWWRCRTHYATNLVAITPASSWKWVPTLPHSVFDQPNVYSVAAQYDRTIDGLLEKLPKVADNLENACADMLAFTAFPKQIWHQIWSTNPGAAQE